MTDTHRPTVSLYSAFSKSLPKAGLGNTRSGEKWGSAGWQRGSCAPIDTHCTPGKDQRVTGGQAGQGGDLRRQGTGSKEAPRRRKRQEGSYQTGIRGESSRGGSQMAEEAGGQLSDGDKRRKLLAWVGGGELRAVPKAGSHGTEQEW